MFIAWSVAVVICCAFIALADVGMRRVPNPLLLILVVGQSYVLVSHGYSLQAVTRVDALLGLIIGLGVSLPFYLFRVMGAGDVKFFAVIGFVLGFRALLPIWLIATVLAGVHACLIVLLRIPSPAQYVALGLATRFEGSGFGRRIAIWRCGRKGIPFAAYLSIGTIYVLSH
ncbi:MAG: A24 family peptidase [Janthinobacterium lividum]